MANLKRLLLAVPLLALFALGACEAPFIGPGVATWTPPPSSTPTCAPNIRLSTPEGWSSSTRLIIVLFDPSSIGDIPLDLTDGSKSSDAYKFVSRIVPELMGPGDQASVFVEGYKDYVDARISRLYSYSSQATLYGTPAPLDTLTPVPAIGTRLAGLVGIATRDEHDRLVNANAMTSTASAMIYQCQVIIWNAGAADTATALQEQEVREHATLAIQMTAEVHQYQATMVGHETAAAGFELYSALKHAALDLSTDCRSYNSCYLLIVDDLTPLPLSRPDYLTLDLQGATPFIVMPRCKDLYQPNCKKVQDYWDQEFQRFGASKPRYFNGLRVESALLSVLGR